jgi:hypothetical protein
MSRGSCTAALALVLWGLASCTDFVAYRPSTAPTANRDPDKLYAAAVRVFLRRGWGFQSRDPVARAVETDWWKHSEVGPEGKPVYLSYRVVVSKGELEFFTSCRLGRGGFTKPCPDGQRPTEVSATEGELLREIFLESNSVADAPTDTHEPVLKRSDTNGPRTASPRDPTACVTACGKDRQSCFASCGRSDKCKEGCAEGYAPCVKVCSN